MTRRKSPWNALTVTSVTNGWSVRIIRKDGTTFIASGPANYAFFQKHADARALARGLLEHGMRSRVVRARFILETE